MEYIPLYARGGAVIPMWPEAPPSTAGHHPEVVELHLFAPVADGTYRSFLQEDDGLTFAALQGACRRTGFEVTRQQGRIRLRADADGDGYPEFAREAFHLVLHGASPHTVSLDGSTLPATGGPLVLPNSGSGFTVELAV